MQDLVCSSSNAQQVIVTINNVQYTCSQLPLTLSFKSGARVSYSFTNVVPGPTGTRYIWNSTTGLGATTRSGNVTVVANGTITANYSTQYYLTMAVSPSSAGSVSATPPGNNSWYYTGSPVTISETPNSGYFFKNWIGIGTVSYTGTSSTASITMDSPITEQA